MFVLLLSVDVSMCSCLFCVWFVVCIRGPLCCILMFCYDVRWFAVFCRVCFVLHWYALLWYVVVCWSSVVLCCVAAWVVLCWFVRCCIVLRRVVVIIALYGMEFRILFDSLVFAGAFGFDCVMSWCVVVVACFDWYGFVWLIWFDLSCDVVFRALFLILALLVFIGVVCCSVLLCCVVRPY